MKLYGVITKSGKLLQTTPGHNRVEAVENAEGEDDRFGDAMEKAYAATGRTEETLPLLKKIGGRTVRVRLVSYAGEKAR